MPQLLDHFKAQMRERHLLIWGTGDEAVWLVRLTADAGGVRGYREVTGPILTTRGRLLVTNYEELTMAAQFSDIVLPEAHQAAQVFDVPAGAYACRVIQAHDPAAGMSREEGKEPDFVIELLPVSDTGSVWTTIPWSQIDDTG